MNLIQSFFARASLCLHAICILLVLPATSLFAQDEESTDDIDEVVVTGSRIVRANITGTTPVVQVDADEVAYQGTVRVEDMMRNLPQVWSNQNTGQSNGATGTATLNLRNLGDPRTLVLVNGRRLPAGSPLGGGGGADINQIPGALIKRVEVLTGGASATYGSDAVGGVVNFLMDDSFEGIRFDYQTSFYNHGNDNGSVQEIVRGEGFPVADDAISDGEISQFTFIVGGDISDRGNIVAYATYRDINHILQSGRDYSSCALSSPVAFCYGSSTIPEGRITNFQNPDHIGFDFKVDGSTFVPRAGTLFNYGPLNYFQRPDERYTFGTFATYDVDESMEVFSEFMFTDDRSVSQIAPSGAFFVTSELSCANPFFSSQQYNQLTQGRLSGDQQTELAELLADLDSDEDREAYLDGAFCQNRIDDKIDAFVGRRNIEGGPRRQDLRHTSFRLVFGARGELTDDWSYEFSVQRAEVSMENTYQNDLGTSKIGRALDAVTDDDGNVVCRSVLNGTDGNCVPWNIFETGAVTQDMIDYLVLPLFARGTTDQTAWNVYVEGDLSAAGWRLPSADNGVIVIAGLESRKEGLDFDPDQGFLNGEGAGQGGATNAVSGSYSVTELFLEGSIPLIEGRNMVDSLTLDTAYRYSDYSTGVDTHTWGIRAGWTINPEVTLRTSMQRAVRAANIRELFSPQGFNLFDMDADPCAGPLTGTGASATTDSGRTLAECARSGVTAAQFGNIQNSPAAQYNFLQGGNPDLDPEESETLLLGVVWEPSMVPGLSLTLDYYAIEITGGISGLGPEFILNECLDGNESQCAFVNRNRTLGDLWIGSDVNNSGHIIALTNNLAIEDVTGIDLIADYAFELGSMGTIEVHNILGYITQWDQLELAGAPIIDCNGKWGGVCGGPTATVRNIARAVWETPWSGLTATAAWRYTSEVEDISAAAVNLDATSYFDLAGVYNINETYLVRAGVNNIFDKAPPLAGDNAGPSSGGNGNVFPGVYDGFGRYVYFGFEVSM